MLCINSNVQELSTKYNTEHRTTLHGVYTVITMKRIAGVRAHFSEGVGHLCLKNILTASKKTAYLS